MANHKNAEVERNLLKHFKLVWIWKLSSWLVYYFFYLSLAPGRVRKIRLLFSVSMYKQKKNNVFFLSFTSNSNALSANNCILHFKALFNEHRVAKYCISNSHWYSLHFKSEETTCKSIFHRALRTSRLHFKQAIFRTQGHAASSVAFTCFSTILPNICGFASKGYDKQSFRVLDFCFLMYELTYFRTDLWPTSAFSPFVPHYKDQRTRIC